MLSLGRPRLIPGEIIGAFYSVVFSKSIFALDVVSLEKDKNKAQYCIHKNCDNKVVIKYLCI